MTLYLVQHGAALAEEVDPERPLSDEGRADIERLAAFLQRGGVRADRVVHSGKTRARQTAELLAGAVGSAIAPESREGLKPKDSAVAFAGSLERTGHLMVVGHLPFLATLVAYLVSGRDEPGLVGFRPGTLVALEPADEREWRIVAMVPPSLLSASQGGAATRQ